MKIGNFEVWRDLPRGAVQFAKKKHFKNKEVVCLEVGILKGKNSLNILKNLNVKKLYLIDPYKSYEDANKKIWNQNLLNETKRKMLSKTSSLRKEGVIEFFEESSDKAIKKIKEKVDFIYLDGNHEYEQIKKDLENSWEILKKGGILAGHDVHIFDVSRAVLEFSRQKNLKVHNWAFDWFIINE